MVRRRDNGHCKSNNHHCHLLLLLLRLANWSLAVFIVLFDAHRHKHGAHAMLALSASLLSNACSLYLVVAGEAGWDHLLLPVLHCNNAHVRVQMKMLHPLRKHFWNEAARNNGVVHPQFIRTSLQAMFMQLGEK
eukprot:4708395-Amphidinium_carterae.1